MLPYLPADTMPATILLKKRSLGLSEEMFPVRNEYVVKSVCQWITIVKKSEKP